MKEKITKKQQDFYNTRKHQLIEKYLSDFSNRIDPDKVRDSFAPIGYDKRNVQQFQRICKILTQDIFIEVLSRNKGKIHKVIFAAGLPASGKTSHLDKFIQNELLYDGTINDEQKFVSLVQMALDMGYQVDVFVYSVEPKRAFKSNLERGDSGGRYVPISHYEKVANSINNRQALLIRNFGQRVNFRNFDHTAFKGILQDFSPLKINRNELERIAKQHKFPDSKTLPKILK